MGVVAAIAAVGSTVVAVTSANNQRKVQEQSLRDQRQANERAEQRAEAEKQRAEHHNAGKIIRATPVWKENKDGMQELGELELITPLIKAVQELSAKVKELEAKLSK